MPPRVPRVPRVPTDSAAAVAPPGRSRERDTERSWGEGKAERQAARGGRGGDRKPREERGPREPRVVKVAEENTVKIAASGFAALAVDDDDN